MKKVFALAAMFALSFTLISATAHEDPKKEGGKAASCCASKTVGQTKDACGDKAKQASCTDKEKAECASHAATTGKKENCDMSKCAGHAQKASTTTPADKAAAPSKN